MLLNQLSKFLWALSLIALYAASASAEVTEEGAPAIMVRPFDGAEKAKDLHDRVVKVLEDQGADLVPAGFEGPTALEADEDYAAVAARLNIRAYILGTATQDNTGWKLELRVRQGSDGQMVGNSTFEASWFPGLLKKIDDELIPTLEAALTESEVPEGAPEEEEEIEEAAPSEETDEPQPLELDAGVGFVFRNYVGSESLNLDGVLPTRDQSGGMANIRVGAAFYPAALFTRGFLANVGLVGHFERSLGGKTQAGTDSTGRLPSGELDTSLTAYDVGLRVRLPVASHELGFSAAYGQHLFEIDDGGIDPGGPETNLVPDVEYEYLRIAADFTYQREAYFLKGEAGFRLVNGAGDADGQIQNDLWFPRSDVDGVDVGVTAGYAISDRFTLTAGIDLRNFFFNMNPRLEDLGVDGGSVRRPVAGGATDTYFAGMFAARYSLR